jgi:hypothetical protein
MYFSGKIEMAFRSVAFISNQKFGLELYHRHLKIIDCLTARVFFVSIVNGCSKKKKKRKLL